MLKGFKDWDLVIVHVIWPIVALGVIYMTRPLIVYVLEAL